eukprot:11360-Heterococcus_DN1.PRE.4
MHVTSLQLNVHTTPLHSVGALYAAVQLAHQPCAHQNAADLGTFRVPRVCRNCASVHCCAYLRGAILSAACLLVCALTLLC